MKAKFKALRGSVVAPKGFLASGVFCDIKRLGTGKGSEKGKKRDLALIVSEVPATAAGMFTTNQVRAAPVKVCVERVKKGTARAIVINSGNANACTGRQGLKDALQMTALTAEALAAVVKRPQASSNATQGPRHSREFPNRIPADHVLVASTGRIGLTLPMDNVKAGIREAVSLLDDALECADHAVEAIMTSDTRAKQIAVEFNLNGRTVRIGGICKGAGMIQPGMSPTGGRPAAVPGRAHSPSAPTGGRGRHHAT